MNLFELMETYADLLNEEGKASADRWLDNCADSDVIPHIRQSFMKDPQGIYWPARHDWQGHDTIVRPAEFVFGG